MIYDHAYMYAAIFDHWYLQVGISEFRHRSEYVSNIPACPQRFLHVRTYRSVENLGVSNIGLLADRLDF